MLPIRKQKTLGLGALGMRKGFESIATSSTDVKSFPLEGVPILTKERKGEGAMVGYRTYIMLTLMFIKQMMEAAGYTVALTEAQVSGAIDIVIIFSTAAFAFMKDQRIKLCGGK